MRPDRRFTGFDEHKLIREELDGPVSRRFLSGYGDDDAQYTALLTAGATFAQHYGLRPGVSLSAEQMKASSPVTASPSRARASSTAAAPSAARARNALC